MPYTGDAIEQIFRQEPAVAAMRRMADEGGDKLRWYVRENTPIDTGELRSSWEKSPVHHRRAAAHGEDTYEVEVFTEVDYAPHVEHGTGLWGPEHRKYLIEPKKPGGLLSWTDRRTGQRVFARRVWHPGSPGQHMMAFGAAKTEATMQAFLMPEVARWSKEQESMFAVARAMRH